MSSAGSAILVWQKRCFLSGCEDFKSFSWGLFDKISPEKGFRFPDLQRNRFTASADVIGAPYTWILNMSDDRNV